MSLILVKQLALKVRVQLSLILVKLLSLKVRVRDESDPRQTAFPQPPISQTMSVILTRK